RGGKNRQPRLQVLDAAAVDTRRRLVLVRRDEVEHLAMIGGPTDIVIESGIKSSQDVQAVRVETTPKEPEAPAPRPVPQEKPEPVARPAARNAEPPPLPLAATANPAPSRAAHPATTSEPSKSPAPSIEKPAADPLPTSRNSDPGMPIVGEPLVSRPQQAAPASHNDVTDVLAAARGRVFQTPARTTPPHLAIPDPSKGLETDFEQFLQQEMASHAPARETAALQPRPTGQPPAKQPVTGATPEPSLQAEVARIFGEMSVTRDK